MPRQKGTVPPAVRIRDNQRRSRQRRKELIEDLKTKLNEYEKLGVQATTEVQLAARKVTWENAQLRDLLASKGISAEEIDYWLQSRQTEAVPLPGQNGEAVNKCTSTAQCCSKPMQKSGPYTLVAPTAIQPDLKLDDASNQSQSSSHSPTQQLKPLLSADLKTNPGLTRASSQTSALRPRTGKGVSDRILTSFSTQPIISTISKSSDETCGFQGSSFGSGPTNTNQDLLPEVSDCYCPTEPSTTLASNQIDASLETPCEVAAGIIVGMRGYGDFEQAKEELGCNGRTSCTVKNTTLFQVMMQ